MTSKTSLQWSSRVPHPSSTHRAPGPPSAQHHCAPCRRLLQEPPHSGCPSQDPPDPPNLTFPWESRLFSLTLALRSLNVLPQAEDIVSRTRSCCSSLFHMVAKDGKNLYDRETWEHDRKVQKLSKTLQSFIFFIPTPRCSTYSASPSPQGKDSLLGILLEAISAQFFSHLVSTLLQFKEPFYKA